MEIRFIKQALDKLSGSPTLYQKADEGAQILVRSQLLDRSVTVPLAHTLYLCNDPDTALDCLRACHDLCVSLLLFGPSMIPELLRIPLKFNLFLMPEDTDPLYIMNYLNEMFDNRVEIEAGIQEIDEAFMREINLQYLAEIAGGVLGNPLWVTGLNYEYLTRPTPELMDDPVFAKELELARVSDENVQLFKERGMQDSFRNADMPVYTIVGHLNMRMMVEPIRIRSAIVAFAHVLEQNHPFLPHDMETVVHFAKLASAELQKSQYFANQRGIAFSYFLLDLLNNKMNNERNLAKHLQALGHRVGPYIHLLKLSMPQSMLSSSVKNNIADGIRFLLPNAIFAVLDDCVVYLISGETRDFFSNYPISRLISFLSINQLKLGVSDCFSNLLDAPHYYATAGLALQLGQASAPGQWLYLYQDLALQHLFAAGNVPMVYHAMAGGALSKLSEYDRAHGTDLVQTAEAYLRRGQNVQRAADDLSIHKNTLRYRLEKIRAVTGLTLEDGVENMQLLLACLYTRYLRTVDTTREIL